MAPADASGWVTALSWVGGAAALGGTAAIVEIWALRERGAPLSRGRYYARLGCVWLGLLLWMVALSVATGFFLYRHLGPVMAQVLQFMVFVLVWRILVHLILRTSLNPLRSYKRYVDESRGRSPEGAAER
jgi:hypothetical protein